MSVSLKHPIAQVLFPLFIVVSLLGPTNASGADVWWKIAAKPYQGTTLHGISENTPASVYVRDVLAKQFERETGIRVELQIRDWEAMYDQSTRDMATGRGTYDFVYIEQDIFYAYLAQNFLVNLSFMRRNYPKLNSPLFDFEDFTSFLKCFTDPKTGDVYGIPMEGFLKVYVYRKDLFERHDIQKAFHERYGYPLKPAQTLLNYRDISAFFTQWAEAHHLDMWGTSVQARVDHPSSFYELVETVFPMFGVYHWGINPDTFRASVQGGGRLNGKRAKEAFAYWLDLLRYAPPEAKGSDWDDVARSFASGRLAQAFLYGENLGWVATDPDRSKVVGKVGIAMPPLYPGVLEEARLGKGYIGYYDGGAFGIPQSSRQKEPAYLWVQFIGQPGVQADWTVKSTRIVHKATFDHPAVKREDLKTGYYSFLEQYGRLYRGAPPFFFHAVIRDIIAPYIHEAIRGTLSPGTALDEAAKEVDRRLGGMVKKGLLPAYGKP